MTSTPVRWAELRPDDFRARRDACPIVYLPIGLCEPHGHIAALGLDLLKAEYFCEQAAQRFGGIVAPAQGYLDEAVLFFLGDGSRFITGQVLSVDGRRSVSEGQIPSFAEEHER